MKGSEGKEENDVMSVEVSHWLLTPKWSVIGRLIEAVL